jgi:hypothetical protein
VHLSFALKAPSFDNFAVRPLTGWVAGYDLNEAQATAKVFDGRTGKAMPANAIAFHVGLPSNKIVDMQIVNIFSQGSGDLIKFPNDGFTVITAFVNGKEVNFADYIIDNKIDIQYPMVADMYGAMINTSFKTIDSENKIVHLFAPVFKDIEYRVGAYIEDYVTEFLSNLPIGVDEKMFFSCNCILNYLYANLESKKTGNATGPVTFGEIAYQLLNQTMTLLTIEDA